MKTVVQLLSSPLRIACWALAWFIVGWASLVKWLAEATPAGRTHPVEDATEAAAANSPMASCDSFAVTGYAMLWTEWLDQPATMERASPR